MVRGNHSNHKELQKEGLIICLLICKVWKLLKTELLKWIFKCAPQNR